MVKIVDSKDSGAKPLGVIGQPGPGPQGRGGGPAPEADVASEPVRPARMFVWTCLILCLAFLVWAAVGRLDIVSMAQGEVIPSTKVKSIQHLEGGIIRNILVREGDAVKAGQAMVELEETAQGSSVEELEVRISSLVADVARLEAMAEGLDQPRLPEGFAENHPDLASQSRELYLSSVRRLKDDVAEQRENVTQRRQDIVEIEARLRNSRTNLKLIQEQIAISENLLKDKLTSRYQHLGFLRDESKLKSSIEEDTAALSRARSSLAEAQAKLAGLTTSYREKARKELQSARRDLDEFTQRMRKLSDSLKRTVIRSPVDGVIKSLRMVTRGGVVRAGETIMEVVPSSDRLVVEAHLPIADIGYVQPGQKAVVKLASRDAGRFGKIDGHVDTVSPDTLTTPDGRTFYSVRIITDQSSFTRGNFEYQLIPGMLVVAYIHTGRRTVLGYLLDPFLDSLDQAMQER